MKVKIDEKIKRRREKKDFEREIRRITHIY